MSKETLAKSIREIPDFPIPGILFYDVTTLFKEPAALQELSDTLYEMYKDKGITKWPHGFSMIWIYPVSEMRHGLVCLNLFSLSFRGNRCCL